MTVTSAISPIDSASQVAASTAIAAKQAMRFTLGSTNRGSRGLKRNRRPDGVKRDRYGRIAGRRAGRSKAGAGRLPHAGGCEGSVGDPMLVVFSRVLIYLAILVACAARSARPGLKSRPACIRRCTVAGQSMVARIGFSATTSRESRQGRKAAAAAAMSGAGARAGASCLPRSATGGDLLRSCRVHS